MAMTLISTSTASSDATVDITSGIDSTYKLYIFKLINIHPATDSAELGFQGNAASGSGFNETITSTFFRTRHDEDAGGGTLTYRTAGDQAQGTGYQLITDDVGNDNDQHASGTLWLFNPSNTTYVKHFYSRIEGILAGDQIKDHFVAGYFNTTSAIDEISFKFSSGNIDSGSIKMYGVG